MGDAKEQENQPEPRLNTLARPVYDAAQRLLKVEPRWWDPLRGISGVSPESVRRLSAAWGDAGGLVAKLEPPLLRRVFGKEHSDLTASLGAIEAKLTPVLMKAKSGKRPDPETIEALSEALERFQLDHGWIGRLSDELAAIAIASDRAQEVLKRQDQATASLEKLRQGTEAVVKRARETATVAVVARYAGSFSRSERGFGYHATAWLVTSGLIGLALAVLFVALIRSPPTFGENLGDAVYGSLSRIAAVSLAITVFIWSLRNYSANRHNQVISLHRMNALQTFESFLDSLPQVEPETRNAVVFHAASCVFAPQSTGFAAAYEDPSPTRIAESAAGLAKALKSAGG